MLLPILTSGPSSLVKLLLNPRKTWISSSFPSLYSNHVSRCLMKTPRIWRPTWEEPILSLIRVSLTRVWSRMNSRVFSLLSVSSTQSFVVERSSALSAGPRATTSMMVTWLSVQMYSSITLPNMMWCLIRIWNTFSEKSCMVDILLMIGIGESTIPTWKCTLSQNYCATWSWLHSSDLQTQPSSSTLTTVTSLKLSCQLNNPLCSDYTLMLKSTIWLVCVIVCSILLWTFQGK